MFEETYTKLENEHRKETTIRQFKAAFNNLGISSLLHQSNIRKADGVGVSILFEMLLLVIFYGKNLYTFLLSPFGKDQNVGKSTVYRFLENPHYNWNKFILLLSVRITNAFALLTSCHRPRFLIMDDSIIPRAKSKCAELLSIIFDHVHNQYIKSYNLLFLGWSDGHSFVPVQFLMMCSSKLLPNAKDRMKEMDKRTCGYKVRVQAQKSKMDAALDMVKRALKAGIQADYLLVDTWFTTEPFIKNMLGADMDVIGMLKDIKQRYWYKGRLYTLPALKAMTPMSKDKEIWGSLYVETRYQRIPVRIVFVENKNKRGECIMILSTDTSLSCKEIITYYGNRWSIECCFKVSKGLLGLGKEYQVRNYDAIVCTTAIVCTRYMLLEWLHRINTDPKTINEYCREMFDEVPLMQYEEALDLLVKMYTKYINEVSKVDAKLGDKMRRDLLNFYMFSPKSVLNVLPDLDFDVYDGKADFEQPDEVA